ncbi:MAG: tRNA (adenosine(37)-N6)-threonylcarbamoyltransferase complex dimerization subunit type 1 TsaB [Bacteroidales bacterium]|nr:tRNA (adenosine(37)-N6)-threonylcarbamoyltransferase complex dimerization subunit type 1 TsaB [Bacteroidales bacterium]
MALILSIDTATAICSVSIGKDGQLLCKKELLSSPNAHSSSLTLLIDSLLKDTGLSSFEIDAFAISQGPGSYTGLRIGTSVAKGLCYATDKPLIAIDTLQAMASAVQKRIGYENIHPSALLVPMIDARRMEVYTSQYDRQLQQLIPVLPQIISEISFLEELQNIVYFFGDGSAKCKSSIVHKNAIFIDNIHTSSENMVALAELLFQEDNFVDVAYYEPFYLKEFQATTPKSNILH